ncbi:MAG TPA: ribulose-phosphate 3-epimerase [Flexilinea sp.]|nr:ribulose-phosphate 3-epimerase [Flexilinea sp.]
MQRNEIIVSASILASDFMRMGEEVQAVAASGTDWIHVDVMDGVFVPNLTLGFPFIEGIRKITTLPLDVHLMIIQPEKHIERFIEAGADILTVHCENNPNIHSTLLNIRKMGASPAIALNPGTPAEMVEPLLPFLDMVLVMTVNPGFGGQEFIPEMLEKMRKIRKWIDEKQLNVRIQVDGGINHETAGQCFAAGADTFVAGTSIFRNSKGYAAGIRELKNLC